MAPPRLVYETAPKVNLSNGMFEGYAWLKENRLRFSSIPSPFNSSCNDMNISNTSCFVVPLCIEKRNLFPYNWLYITGIQNTSCKLLALRTWNNGIHIRFSVFLCVVCLFHSIHKTHHLSVYQYELRWQCSYFKSLVMSRFVDVYKKKTWQVIGFKQGRI
jgi:hypothetical protein